MPRADSLRLPGVVFLARLIVLWSRYGRGAYHRARGRIVLFDRYVLDGAVPPGASPGPLGQLSRRVQRYACPLPDLVLFLDASGETMHRRSGEYDAARLESWRRAYARLQDSVPTLAVLDAERPAEVVLREAQARVWARYARR
jgi:thymidylate kinase